MGNEQQGQKPKQITPNELQTYIMIVKAKLAQQRNKKVFEITKKTKELLQYLRDNNPEMAKLKMDGIIQEENYITAYDILGTVMEILKEKCTYLLNAPKCPNDMRATLDTVIYASTRLEIAEFTNIRDLITLKYGGAYVSNANVNADKLVNKQIVEKLTFAPNPEPYLIARIKQICKENDFDYTFPQEVVPIDFNNIGEGGLNSNQAINFGATPENKQQGGPTQGGQILPTHSFIEFSGGQGGNQGGNFGFNQGYNQGQSNFQGGFNQGQPQFGQGQGGFNQGQSQFNQGQSQLNQGQGQSQFGGQSLQQGQSQFQGGFNQGQSQFNQGSQGGFNQGQSHFNQSFGSSQGNPGNYQSYYQEPNFNQGQSQFNAGQSKMGGGNNGNQSNYQNVNADFGGGPNYNPYGGQDNKQGQSVNFGGNWQEQGSIQGNSQSSIGQYGGKQENIGQSQFGGNQGGNNNVGQSQQYGNNNMGQSQLSGFSNTNQGGVNQGQFGGNQGQGQVNNQSNMGQSQYGGNQGNMGQSQYGGQQQYMGQSQFTPSVNIQGNSGGQAQSVLFQNDSIGKNDIKVNQGGSNEVNSSFGIFNQSQHSNFSKDNNPNMFSMYAGNTGNVGGDVSDDMFPSSNNTKGNQGGNVGGGMEFGFPDARK